MFMKDFVVLFAIESFRKMKARKHTGMYLTGSQPVLNARPLRSKSVQPVNEIHGIGRGGINTKAVLVAALREKN